MIKTLTAKGARGPKVKTFNAEDAERTDFFFLHQAPKEVLVGTRLLF